MGIARLRHRLRRSPSASAGRPPSLQHASTRPSRGVYKTSASTSSRRGMTETLIGGLPLRPLMMPFPLDRSATSSIFLFIALSLPSPSLLTEAVSTGVFYLARPNPKPRHVSSSPILPDNLPANFDGSTPVTMSMKLSALTAMP